MESTDYHNITSELMGSFFEAFLKYNALYKTIAKPINERICHHLFQRHLEKEPRALSPKEYQTGLYSKNFLIAHHLIPEQLLAYPAL